MKTIGRILVILVVFSIFAGLMVTAVNASSTKVSQFRPDGGGDRVRPGGGGGRPERGEGEAGGSRWAFGLIKNIGVMAVLVTVIVWPKSMVKKKKRMAVINSTNSEA